MIEAIDHVGIAVSDLEEAVKLYSEQLGLREQHREIVDEQGVEAVLMECGDGHVELLAPLGPDTLVGKFLARRGPGLHHIAYRVADIDEALATARNVGLRLIDEAPRQGIAGSRVAFVHPSSVGGVLTELVEPRLAATSGSSSIGEEEEGVSSRLETGGSAEFSPSIGKES